MRVKDLDGSLSVVSAVMKYIPSTCVAHGWRECHVTDIHSMNLIIVCTAVHSFYGSTQSVVTSSCYHMVSHIQNPPHTQHTVLCDVIAMAGLFVFVPILSPYLLQEVRSKYHATIFHLLHTSYPSLCLIHLR